MVHETLKSHLVGISVCPFFDSFILFIYSFLNNFLKKTTKLILKKKKKKTTAKMVKEL